jgi:hypothetical protein
MLQHCIDGHEARGCACERWHRRQSTTRKRCGRARRKNPGPHALPHPCHTRNPRQHTSSKRIYSTTHVIPPGAPGRQSQLLAPSMWRSGVRAGAVSDAELGLLPPTSDSGSPRLSARLAPPSTALLWGECCLCCHQAAGWVAVTDCMCVDTSWLAQSTKCTRRACTRSGPARRRFRVCTPSRRTAPPPPAFLLALLLFGAMPAALLVSEWKALPACSLLCCVLLTCVPGGPCTQGSCTSNVLPA